MKYKVFSTFVCLCSLLPAQDGILRSPRFGTKAYLREHFESPVPRIELKPPVKLADYVVNGKLELSLKSYLDLVMANNTDIEIQKVTIETARNAITAAFAVYDPTVIATFNASRSNSLPSSALDGSNTVVSTLNQPYQLTYNGILSSGTQYTIGFNGARNVTSNSFSTYNPSLTGNLAFSFSQPLLRNRGGYITRMPITMAKSRLRQSQYNLEAQVLSLVQTAESAYWNVIGNREALKVQENGLQLQDASLKLSQKQLELGAISPLDIYLPQQRYAQADIAVVQARYQLEQVTDALRRQMGADLDPQFQHMEIVLTEPVDVPTDSKPYDKEQLVEQAYSKRPDLKATQQNIDLDDLSIRTAKNALLPNLALTGGYTSAGRGGINYVKTNVFTDGQNTSVTNIIPGGFGDALSQMFAFNYPTYQMGLRLTLPIRDHAATAALANASVQKKIDALRVRTSQQSIRQDVLNAITQVENSKASVNLSKTKLDFAQKAEEAEKQKYDLGVSTLFLLLDAQNTLTQAQSDLVTQSVNYRRNLLNLLRVTGTLLDERGIALQ